MPGGMGAAMGRKKAKKAAAAAKAAGNGPGGPKKGQVAPDEAPPAEDDGKLLAARMKSRKIALKFMKEFLIFTVWVLAFSATILMTRDNTMAFQYSNLFKAYIIENNGWADNMKTVDDFWDFIGENSVKILSEDIFTSLGDDFGAADESYLFGNKRIAELRIRQVRVPSEVCTPQYLENIVGADTADIASIRCYPSFSGSAELETKFTKEGETFEPDVEAHPWFQFWTHEELGEMSTWFGAEFASYPGSGYVVDVNRAWLQDDGELLMEIAPFTASTTAATEDATTPTLTTTLKNVTLSDIKNSRWIDLKTRVVFFDFTFFNPNLNVFLVARVAIEFLPSGIVSLYRTFRIVDPFRFSTNTSGDLMVMGLNGLVVIITLMYLVEEVRSLAAAPMKYLKQFWHCIALVNVILMFALLGLTASNELNARTLFQTEEGAALKQGDLQSLGFLLDQERNLQGIIAIFMWVRFYKYCSISRKLSTLTRTLSKSAGPLVLMTILLLIAGVGFALGCTLILGADNYNFYNTYWSMYTLMRAAFGDFDYTEWQSNRAVGPLLLICWLFFSNVVLLNIIVAVMCEAFTNVMMENEDLDEKGVKSVLDIFLESGILGRGLAKRMAKRKGQIEDMEAALSAIDADGDGMTDINELEQFIKSTGADKLLGITAIELMAKYDTDGSGQLDAEEMEEIKQYIMREKELKTPAGNELDIDETGGVHIEYEHNRYQEFAVAGGGLSAAVEERILNIESNVTEIKAKVNLILSKLDQMGSIGPADGHYVNGHGSGSTAGGARLSTSTRNGSRSDGGKLIANKSIVNEEY